MTTCSSKLVLSVQNVYIIRAAMLSVQNNKVFIFTYFFRSWTSKRWIKPLDSLLAREESPTESPHAFNPRAGPYILHVRVIMTSDI